MILLDSVFYCLILPSSFLLLQLLYFTTTYLLYSSIVLFLTISFFADVPLVFVRSNYYRSDFLSLFYQVYGVDDELLKEKVRSIPRDDVAEVCLQCLIQDDALNRSFDIISKEPSEDTKPTKDWKAWFSMNKGTCKY